MERVEREKRKYAGVRKVRLLNATCCNLAQSGEFPSFDRGTRTCVFRGASTRVRARESILLLSLLPLLPLLFSSKDRGVALLWESERNLRSRRRYAYRRIEERIHAISATRGKFVPSNCSVSIGPHVRIINSTLANVYRQP